MDYEIKIDLVIMENGKEKYNLKGITGNLFGTNGKIGKTFLLEHLICPKIEEALQKAKP